jgi:hypothetical protein
MGVEWFVRADGRIERCEEADSLFLYFENTQRKPQETGIA